MNNPKPGLPRKLLFAGIIAGMVAVTTAFLWTQQKNALEYTSLSGPVEDITTGLIGEYAALILIAENQGYFKENGLNVTITEYPSGPASLADLWAGKIDTAMASDFAGVRDSLNGEDMRILANMSKSEAFYIVARKDHGISEVSHLKGKNIGITHKTVGEFFLEEFLNFNSIGTRDVQLTNMPQAELGEAIINGQIDAAVLFEPNAYETNLRLGDQAVRWSVHSRQSIYSLLYTTGKFNRERPEALRRYLRAVVQAEYFVKDNDALARNIIAERLNYDEAYINYIWPKFSFEVSLDQELLINMDDQARWTIENNLTTAKEIPNYLWLINFEALEAVNPEAITVIR